MKQNKNQFIIGVTGGIGSGKSLVAKILKNYDFEIINADFIYGELMKSNSDMISEIVKEFGESIVDGNNKIIRTELSAKVFKSKEMLKTLNKITHKYVVAEMANKIDYFKEKNVKNIVLDVPIPVKVGFIDICSQIWVVVAEKSIRIDRILKRNPELNIYEIEKRIENQLSEDEYKKLADRVIYNNGDIDELEKIIKMELDISY